MMMNSIRKTVLCVVALLLLPKMANAAIVYDSEMSEILEEYDGVGLAAWSIDEDANVCSLGSAGERIKGSGEELKIAGNVRFHVGSITKSITSTLIAVLIEDGAIESWNSTLADLLPAEASGTEYENVTIQELLGMMSGIPRDPTNFFSYEQETDDLLEQRRLATMDALRSTPESPPGTSDLYSNWGYVVAGYIIESLSGALFEEVVIDRIFAPLGFDELEVSSSFYAPTSRRDPWGHSGLFQTPCDPTTDERGCDLPKFMAAAGLFSGPIAAMSEFFAFHLACHNGNHTAPLLTQETCQYIHKPANASVSPYGFGWLFTKDERAAADGEEEGLVASNTGSNTVNLYQVSLAFDINRAVVSYTNQLQPLVQTVNMTTDAQETLINGTQDCSSPFTYNSGNENQVDPFDGDDEVDDVNKDTDLEGVQGDNGDEPNTVNDDETGGETSSTWCLLPAASRPLISAVAIIASFMYY